MSRARYRYLLFAAAFLFSTGGAGIKASTLTSWQIASFRAGIAAISVAVLLPESRRIANPRVFAVGLFYAATVVLYVLANRLTSSANAIFLQATAPLYLLVFGPWLLRERLRRSDLLLVVAVIGGCALLLFGAQHVGQTAPHPREGNWLALLSGLTWALTITGFRWLGKRGSGTETPASVVVAGNLIACVVCLPLALPVTHTSLVDSEILLYLGVVQVGLGCMALTRSIPHVAAIEAATLLLIEPVFNPVWSWLLHGERLSAAAMAGGALILCATLGSGMAKRT